MSFMPLDHMKITVLGSRNKAIWPQLHFTHDEPSSSSTLGTKTPESAQEDPRDFSR